jgi:flagellar hook-length control protein FliK
METTAQSITAATQSSVNPAVGNVTASSKASAQTAADNMKNAKSFTDVLVQALNGESSVQSGNETNGLAALLGLSPALIQSLLTQGQTDQLGSDQTQGIVLDPAILKALQVSDEQSDGLNQLIDSGAFQQWLSQVSELLSSMNAGNAAAPESSLQSSNDQALPKNAVQAQTIMNQFITALSQNKDSLLFQQLIESFQEIVSPVLSAQAAPKALTQTSGIKNGNLIDGLNNKSKDNVASLLASVNTILGASSNAEALTAKEANVETGFKFQLLQGTKPFTRLDALSAKSGLAEQMMLAALQAGSSSEDDLNSDVVTPNTTLPFQELSRTLQTEQVKALQPMTAQSFVQDMSQFVMKSFKVDALTGFSEAHLTLSPENLGKVDVKLTMHNGQLVAHFAAQTVLGKEMLEGQLSQLKQSLQGQGLQVERLEVTQNSSLQSSLFQDQRQQQFSQQFARQNKSRYNDMDSVTESFSVEMANMAKLRSAYGNAFDVTA